MDETGLIGVLLSWLPMLLLVAVWIYFMRYHSPRAAQQQIVDEYIKHNELLRQVIERMDQCIARLESRDEAGK